MEFLIGLVVLVADIYAIIQILSSSATTAAKIIWTLVILFLPVLGLIVWYFAGPKPGSV
ncbi:phospholipase D-like protein [Aliiruegeria haliotis]|uniref:Phospholipase D-like protein n=1 Tax=Aliiruegeria haliotis TaxID=1280846 RepID=A0A2T0RLY0_9RHOB|nr:PLD nuclease N-terminal domain-containing protein [Aliiruegeria haliotis]PRY22130.1 phospholipase D-like protein [Aliiruegeria haliotis]